MNKQKIYALIDSDGEPIYAFLDKEKASGEANETGCYVHEVSCSGLADLQAGFDEAIERWNKLKDIFQLTIDNYGDLHELESAVSYARNVLNEMKELEGK